MSENNQSQQKEIFTECPFNKGLLVGNSGTIIDSKTKRELEQFVNPNGYLIVKNTLKNDKNKREYEFVHRIIGLTYVRGYSRHNWICHHKDKNRRNNSPDNLLWTSEYAHNKLHNHLPFILSA